MTGEQVYVSHAPSDLELVQTLFSTVKNLPFDVHIALEEVDSNRTRDRLESRIPDSDVVVAVLTDRSADSRWVNQEIGYARAERIPIFPVYTDERHRGGYLADIEGCRSNETTSHELSASYSAVSDTFSSRSDRSRFPTGSCGFPVRPTAVGTGRPRDRRATVETLETTPSRQAAGGNLFSVWGTYYFNPATLGFIRRDPRHSDRRPRADR